METRIMEEEEEEPLEISLRNLIAQQASMIEELRAQNSTVLEHQKSNIRDEIIRELKPLLQPNSEPQSKLEISQSFEKSPDSKRRQRPGSAPKFKEQDEDGLVVRMEGYTSIKSFERGRIKHSNVTPTSTNNGHRQAQSLRQSKKSVPYAIIDSSPLNGGHRNKSFNHNSKKKSHHPNIKEEENSRKTLLQDHYENNYKDEKKANEEEEEGGSDSDDEGKYGYKNALWLQRSRSLLEAVKDDKTVEKLYDERGRAHSDLLQTSTVENGFISQNDDHDNNDGHFNKGQSQYILDHHQQHQNRQNMHSSQRRRRLGGGNENKFTETRAVSQQDEGDMNSTGSTRGGAVGNDEDESEESRGDGMEGSSRYAPAPTKAGESAWENEIARNILNLYASKVKIEDGIEQAMKKRFEKPTETKYSEDGKPLLQPLSARLTPRADGAPSPLLPNNTNDIIVVAKTTDDDGGGGRVKHNEKKGNPNKKKNQSAAQKKPIAPVLPKKPKVVVTAPRSTASIWFTGSGSVAAEWTALQQGEEGQNLQANLDAMEEAKEYSKYIATVESFLEARLRASLPGEITQRLWRQLVVTMNAFASRCVDQKSFALALDLLSRALRLAGNAEVFSKKDGVEISAFINDTYAYYYMKRGKYEAALAYCEKAMKTHVKFNDWGHVAKCHLHSASILAKLNRKDESIRCNAQVLAMVENGRLEVGGTAPQRLCLVAVCYHNIAVEQLHMRLISEACVSAQNARRLARLCLSYSTRFLKNFENTHQVALEELSGVAADKNNKEAARMFKRLLKQL